LAEHTRRAGREVSAMGQLCRIVRGALLGAAMLAPSAWGAEVRGRITLANGQPVANEPIVLAGSMVGRTDVAGVYWLNLPAGTHTIIVKGQSITIQVSPNGGRQDIQLR
jgi:hypothetical protein